MSFRSIRIVRWAAWTALCVSAPLLAADHSINGAVLNLLGQGLQLKLVDSPGCLADGTVFTIQSTNTNDCTSIQNVDKCCSQSIRFTSTDGISTVMCTCGVIIIPRLEINLSSRESEPQGSTASSQLITLAPGTGVFTFPTPIPDISYYSVTIASQPTNPSQHCSLSHAGGVINGRDVVNIYLDCIDGIFADGLDAR